MLKRLDEQGRALALGPMRLAELPEARSAGATQRRADEASRLLEAASDADLKVALDGAGKAMTSDGLGQMAGR